MRLDLTSNYDLLNSLPRFQSAKKRLVNLLIGRSIFLTSTLALFFLAALVRIFYADSVWVILFCNNAATLLLLYSVLQSALEIDNWRSKALDSAINDNIDEDIKKTTPLSGKTNRDTSKSHLNATDKLNLFTRYSKQIVKKIGSIPLFSISCSLISLIIVYTGWNMSLVDIDASKAYYAVVVFLAITIFSLLVVERYLSAISKNQWPEATYIALIIRIVIAVQVLSLVSLLFIDVGRIWPLRLLTLTGLLPIIVAIEFILHALFAIFSPQRETLEPNIVGKSLLATMLKWPPQPLTLLQDELQRHFNIDLRQVWAFGFIRKAFLPIAITIFLIGWLLTSINVVSINHRGIYERFGQPINVLQPGLHVGLPWPFGKVIFVENGVIHEITTFNDNNNQEKLTAKRQIDGDNKTSTMEGIAPFSANRLWDDTHRSEMSQIIASTTNDKQNFQILNMDVRFIYRIGLQDQNILDATYNNVDIPVLIKNIGNRVLVHEFSSHTLDEVLTGSMQKVTSNIKQHIQQDLDKMKSGVELLAVVIEAIHPPAGAADAYHGVQAAQIMADVLIAKERGKAAESMGQAYIVAGNTVNKSLADAKDNVALAQSDSLNFKAESTAWQQAGQAFLLEKYFAQLTISLAQTPLLIIDHRLKTSELPTIDLRKYSSTLDATVKPNTQTTGD